MKRTILALALNLLVGLTSIMAADPQVDPRILANFKKEFGDARQIRWDVNREFTRAHFLLNQQGLIAYFDREGELVSLARNILYNQLPITVIKSLEKKFPSTEFSGIVEVTSNNETSYLMTVEQKGKKLQLQVNSSGYITKVSKTKS